MCATASVFVRQCAPQAIHTASVRLCQSVCPPLPSRRAVSTARNPHGLCQCMCPSSPSRLAAYTARNPHGLYDTLETEELKQLQARESSDGRLAFMAHLKSLGVEKLSDRQLFVNALGRAKRAGLLPGQSRAGGAPA